MDATHMIQYMEDAKHEVGAHDMFEFLRMQIDFLGGRILPPGPGKPHWRVQAFFQDSADEPLPDGCRRVLVLPSQRRALGLA